MIERVILFFSYSGNRSDTFRLGFFLERGGEMKPLREMRGLQRESAVDALTGTSRSWFRLPTLLHCLFWAGSGNSLQLFPYFSMCLHGKLSVIISKWAVSSFRHN